MRRIYLIPVLFIFLIILSSCNASNKMSDGNEYIKETDFPYYFLSETSELRIAKSDRGYYILNGNYIYFMEEDDENPVILDNRPNHECLETKNGENCDAYVQINQYQSILFQFYDDHLYFIEAIKEETEGNPELLDIDTYQLVQMSPDGSERKVIRTFEQATISGAAIHRGDLYYIAVDYDKDDKKAYQISRVPLHKGKKKPEILVNGSDVNGQYSKLIPYGTQLYFMDWGNTATYKYMHYDLIDHELTELSEQPDEIATPNIANNMLMIDQDKLYFWYYDMNYYTDNDEPTKEIHPAFDPLSLMIYSSDLDGSNVKETNIRSAEIISNVYHDQRYTYVRPVQFQLKGLNRDKKLDLPDEMKIYQNENELVHTIDTTDFTIEEHLVPGDERYMFMFDHGWDDDEDDSYIVYKFYYLDKNEIETGKADFKKLLENKTGNGDGWQE